ncbi:hypothetical protein AVEN_163713-1 [Araneus ventricosus]|uniref:Uncharacterized protein n=1 Tax=Araneus ventricosus TaxID=182803 RepID=A0A4Y2HZK5_ARAVE|nr:hypothetical protein AVEN_163713-1 [Araneus ventricosus]
MSNFEATRGVFWDETRNFEPRSDERTIPELAPPLQSSAPHQREEFGPLRMIQCATAPTADLQWNLVLNPEPSGSKAECIPRGPTELYTNHFFMLHA